MSAQTINIADVRVNGGTQSRASIDRGVVSDYAEAMKDGAEFPPIVVFFDGSAYWLADGFHRYEAYSLAQVYDVPADVRQGTQRDAILFSVGANAAHGLRRTNDDKRRAVMTLLNDPEWAAWSDREIGRQCGVGNRFVGDVRKAHCVPDTVSQERTYTTKHGTTATMQTANIGTSSAGKATDRPAPEPDRAGTAEPIQTAPDSAKDDPETKARREIARLSQDGMIDEIIGLRADLDDAKARIEEVTRERDDFKAKWKEATSSDLGRALGNAQRRLDTVTGRMNEYQAQVKRMEFRAKKAEARVKELEDMEVVPA
ncbi:MAG: ParB N-terminal domain-containing protein [Brevundimonas sp.]|uniref:ParB N-terminal domain-containing protein n=1 Tax=Brevundimonas sp. TaxID=1871086 RepID=UPI00391A74B7